MTAGWRESDWKKVPTRTNSINGSGDGGDGDGDGDVGDGDGDGDNKTYEHCGEHFPSGDVL